MKNKPAAKPMPKIMMPPKPMPMPKKGGKGKGC